MSRPGELTESEMAGLKLLSEMLQGERSLSRKEKQIVADFVANCISNMELNAVIFNARQELVENPNIHIEVIYIILKMTFHTRGLEALNEKFENISSSHQKLLKGESLSDAEKLSLTQFAILHNLAALRPILQSLAHHGVIPIHDELKLLHEKVITCHKLEKILEKQRHEHEQYKPDGGLNTFEHSSLEILANYFRHLTNILVSISESTLQRKP